jgi:hypothetical protein
MEQKLLFDFNKDVNASFFREIPGLSDVKYFGNNITKKADSLEIYISSFREKFIEKDNLLDITELNDDSRIPAATYREIEGYSQNLYILKYQFFYFGAPVEAAVFFSIKKNRDDSVIGIMPCYFGIINREDNLISFDNELVLKRDKDSYYLKMIKRKNDISGLLFMPANFPENPVQSETRINIEKIVKLDANKVGGYKPLVFNISKIFHDSTALQFHFDSTLHLNR